MQLVNILLTIGLIVIVSGLTVLSLCAIIASSKSEQEIVKNNESSDLKERRKNIASNFPVTCKDGTMVYFDRRLET